MQFDELMHWNDGQFLQPHHFQCLQRQVMSSVQKNRFLLSPYPWGLIDLEIEEEGLAAGRVVIKKFSAILSDGTSLSMPNNCIIAPLELRDALKSNPNEITVYIALPNWSEVEANFSDEETQRHRYSPVKKRFRDENTGSNEIILITRRYNAYLTYEPQNIKDCQIMPLIKLNVLSHDKTERALKINEKFFPPFFALTSSSPLFGILNGLLADIRRCRDKALDILTGINFKNENLSGYNAYTVLRLKTLNVYEQRLSSLLSTRNVSPFDMYLELTSLLCELMAYDPINSIRSIKRYDHDDSAPAFFEIIKDIRSFILKEGSVDYICIDFKPIEEGRYLFCTMKPEEIFRTKSAFVALKTTGDKDAVIKAVEEGDTFKMINPQSKQLRIRGIKLTEEAYPPRFLPVLANTLWFKLDLAESSRIWREITDEGGIAIDFVANLFPDISISLYLTMGDA